MSFANLIQNNFNGGEISPLLHARSDLQTYVNGLATCKNFIPRLQGALTRRAGTYFIKEVRASADKTALVSFSFNDANFVLEFADNFVRFYKDRQPYIVSGSHYEIASPYDKADLFDEHGVFLLSFAQSADVIYICHPQYAPRKLKRLSNSNWQFEVVSLDWPAFDKINEGDTKIYASGVSGTITLTSTANLFNAFDVGTQIYLEQSPDTTVKVWEAGVNLTEGDIVKSGGRYYLALNSHTSGSVQPTHEEGVVSDGKIDWQYLHSGYGYAEITGYTNATTITAVVKSRLPNNIVGIGNASKKWAFSNFNVFDGFPEFVAFYKERLVFAKGIYLFFSVVGDYENFALKSGPDITSDMGIALTILSKDYNGIRWIYPYQDDLLIGTKSTLHLVGASTPQQIFSAQNITSKSLIGRGASNVTPVQVDSRLFFLQRSREILLGIVGGDGFSVEDFSMVSNHLFDGGVVGLAYQERPDSILWALREDGKLLGFTINELQEVKGWHLHEFKDGFVESICTVSSPNGEQDDLMLVVRREIGGATKRYIEYMSNYFEYQLDIADAHFVDSGVLYDGVKTSTITGLSHLNGVTVDILADGAVQPSKLVSSGQITLNYPASKVHVGIGYESIMKTLSFEGGGQKGVSSGKSKRINRIQIKFYKSLGGKVRFANGDFEPIVFRTGNDAMGQAVQANTGYKDLLIGNTYQKDAQIEIIQNQPLPTTVLAIMPEMVAYES